jgi:RNA polymerase sigma-70 factor, ECF subfamily
VRGAGFAEFMRIEFDGIVRALTLVLGDRAVAEDSAQEAFARALLRWRQVSAMERPATWVYVVAVRHGRRHLMRSGRVIESVEGVSPEPANEIVDGMWIADLVAQLPPRQRAAVVLRHAGGLRLAEIADALGIRTGTVKSSLHAAYRTLRIRIESEADEVADHAS